MKKLLLILLNLTLLTACAVNVPVKATYTLNETSPQHHQNFHKPKTILISMPTANVGYETKNMLYTLQPYEIKSFSKHQWAGPPAKMLLPLLIQHLDNTGYFQATATPPLSAYNHKLLKTHLLELQQDFSVHPSCIRLSIRADIIDKAKDTVLASQVFTTNIPTNSDTPYGGVIATNKATRILLDQIAWYCVQHLIDHPIRLPPPKELRAEVNPGEQS